jgi:hypothetical protein
MSATIDRGAVLHHAALHRLSPALRAGAPALVPSGEGAGERCGWEPFFRALEGRRLAVALGEEGPDVAFVPRAAARSRAKGPPTPGRLSGTGRFLRALAGKL